MTCFSRAIFQEYIISGFRIPTMLRNIEMPIVTTFFLFEFFIETTKNKNKPYCKFGSEWCRYLRCITRFLKLALQIYMSHWKLWSFDGFK